MQGVQVAEPSGGTSIQALGVHLSENVGSTHGVLHGAVCLSLIKKKKKKCWQVEDFFQDINNTLTNVTILFAQSQIIPLGLIPESENLRLQGRGLGWGPRTRDPPQ